MDELTDSVDDSVMELLHNPESFSSIDPEAAKILRTLETDERYAYMSAYMKLSADPEEVYLRMLVSAGIATADEQKKLDDLITKKTLHEASLPPTAWLIDPVFPDIIKEYIVSYAVNERDLDRFTKLARQIPSWDCLRFLRVRLRTGRQIRRFRKLPLHLRRRF